MKTTHKLYTALGVAAILTGAATTGLAVSSGISLQADAAGENLLANAIIGQTIGTTGSGNWSAVKNDGTAATWNSGTSFRDASGSASGSGEVYFLLTRWDGGDHNVYYTYTFDNLEAGVYEFQMTSGSWNNFDANQIASSQVDFKGMRATFGTQGGYSLLHQVLDIPMKTSNANAGLDRYNDTKVTATAKFSVETAGQRAISFTGCHDIMPICDLSLVKVAGAEAIPSVTAVDNAGNISFTAEAGTQIYTAYITDGATTATYSLLPSTSYKVSSNGTLYYYAVNADGVRSEVKTLAVADVPEKALPTNLLKNATTYEGEGWTTWNSAGTTSVADGVLTLSKTSDQNGDYGLYQNLQLESGKTYTFMASYRTSGTNQSKTQFCGFWNANASWVAGDYSDLETSSFWKQTHNTLTSNGTAKCALLATNGSDHTVEYKDVWVIEHPVLTVKMDGETATDHVNTGSLVAIESNLQGFDIYYAIDGGTPMLYDGEFNAPAQSGTISYHAEFNGLTFTAAEIAVASEEDALAAAKADYERAVEEHAHVITGYADASAEKLSVFNPGLDDSTTIEQYRAAIDAMNDPANLRAAALSHAVAEGVEGAVSYTSRLLQATIGDEAIGAHWNDDRSSDANYVRVGSGEVPEFYDGFTHYYDTDNWGKSGQRNTLSQVVNLPAGKYRVALMARSANLQNYTLAANDAQTNLSVNGADGQMFGRGWNDHTLDFETLNLQNTIAVTAHGSGNSTQCWASWNNFRLTKTGELENTTVSLNGYTGEDYTYVAIVLPYTVTGFDNAGVEVYALTGVNADGQAVITKVEDGILQAGTPYLLALEGSSADVTLTFSGTPVEETVAINGDGAVFNSSLIPVTLPAATAAAGARRRAASTEGVHYVLNAAGTAFEKVTADTELPANSTYLTLPADSEIAANFDSLAVTRDINTGINAIGADVILDSEAIYDLQGRRVVNPAKGIYIRNGKKIVVR